MPKLPATSQRPPRVPNPSSPARQPDEQHEEVDVKRPAPRIYRVRAARFNGRLALPLTLEDGRQLVGGGGSPFGLRAAPTAKPAAQQAGPSANCDERSSQAASQVAASSQTLRLTSGAANRTQPMAVLGGQTGNRKQQPEIEGSESALARQAIAKPAGLLAARASHASPHLEEPQLTGGGLQLGSVADLVEPGEPARSLGGDSILALVDDYDSKIITNRTKGESLH